MTTAINSALLASWKTTAAGWISAAAIAIIPVLETGHFNTNSLILAGAIGILGTLSKDHDTTGNPPASVEDPTTKITNS